MSLLFRQTNIIWVAFIAWSVLLTDLSRGGMYVPSSRPPNRDGQEHSWTQELAKTARSLSTVSREAWATAVSHLALYSSSALCFTGFLVWNGGIVLGDKTNHQAGLHIMQLPYFALFTSLFAWPYIFCFEAGASSSHRIILPWIQGQIRSVVYHAIGTRRRAVQFAILLLGLAGMVRWGTVLHPFLLADNRHYAFYFRRRLLSMPLTRYALILPYALSARIWWDKMMQVHNILWTIGLLGSTALVLVPSPLLEPRYFIVPYLIVRLNLPFPHSAELDVRSIRGTTQTDEPPPPYEEQGGHAPHPPVPVQAHKVVRRYAAVELAWSTALNIITMYIFLYRPFTWPQEPGRAQRFMW